MVIGTVTATGMEIGNEIEIEESVGIGIGNVMGTEVVVEETTRTMRTVGRVGMMTDVEERRSPLRLERMELLMRGGEGEGPRRVLLSEGLRLQKVVFRYRRGGERLRDGTSMPLDTSNIRHCKPSKRVRYFHC